MFSVVLAGGDARKEVRLLCADHPESVPPPQRHQTLHTAPTRRYGTLCERLIRVGTYWECLGIKENQMMTYKGK